MKAMAPRRTNEGFTIIELLVVMGIIAILAGMLVPAVIAARRTIKEGATRIEIKGLEAAFVLYAHDWGTYPPDKNADMGYESGECLVYYLSTKFQASSDPETYCTLNGGPYYEFPGDRLESLRIDNDWDAQFDEDPIDGLDNDGDGFFDEDPPDYRFVDLLRNTSSRDVYWYRFDNNDAEDGGQIWVDLGLPYNQNVANVHPMGVDIWSTGWDGVDRVSTVHPTQKKIGWSATKEDLEDDLGNW